MPRIIGSNRLGRIAATMAGPIRRAVVGRTLRVASASQPAPRLAEWLAAFPRDPCPAVRQRVVDLALELAARQDVALPCDRWGPVARSHPGLVRGENQDAAVALRIGEHDVLVIADGCGGHALGRAAAILAVVATVRTLVRGLPGPNSDGERPVEALLADCFPAACSDLEAHRLTLEVPVEADALRTTLIVAVTVAERVVVAYLGDGGAELVRARDGQVVSLLAPMKASSTDASVLAGVLGPTMHGAPATRSEPFDAGDTLVVATDGVADRVPADYPLRFVRALTSGSRAPGEVLEEALGELAAYLDGNEHVFDDNLTLGVLRRRPSTLSGTTVPMDRRGHQGPEEKP